MNTKNKWNKKKSRVFGKLKGKKRSKILRGGGGMNRNTKTLVNNGIEWVYVPKRIHIAVNKTQKKLSRPPRQPRQPQLSQLSQPLQKLLNLSISNGETNNSRQSITERNRLNSQPSKINDLYIYEKTNNAIGIEWKNENNNIIHFTIIPTVLNVDIMQYAINTNSIVISEDGKFMTFINLPSLFIRANHFGSYGSYRYSNRSRESAFWCLIEENGTESKTFNRPKLSKNNRNNINNTNIGKNVNNIEYKIDTPISKLQGEITNEQVFLAPIDKLSEYDDRRLCLYRANVIYKLNESDETGEPRELYERIDYLKYITQWLENIDNKIDNNETKCDLYGLEKKYIITHTFINTDVEDQYKEEYIICGYPNQETKQLILNFWQGLWKDENIFKDSHNDNLELFIKLFNQKNNGNINNSGANKDTQLYKFYYSTRKNIFDYIKARYKEIDISKSSTFDTVLDNNVKIYFNAIADKYLHKFMSYIKYNFFIFKKHFLTDVSYKLIPAVFNIRELTSIHKPILERINKLIRNELPRIFGISLEENYNSIETYNTDLYNEDKEYKLFYSHYRHGQVFHIKTEYLHSMSNISDKAHGYKYGLTLEEIIYNLSDKELSIPYFRAVKFIYEVREHQIDNYDLLSSDNIKSKVLGYSGIHLINKSLSNILNNEEKKKNRSDIVYGLYEEDKFIICFYKNIIKETKEYNLWKITDFTNPKIKSTYDIWKSNLLYDYKENQNILKFYTNILKLNIKNYKNWRNNSFVYSLQEYYDWKNNIPIIVPNPATLPIPVKLNNKILKNIKFILKFESSTHEYTFIYILNDSFYKLVIQSNISDMTDIILQKLNPNSEFIDKTISFESIDFKKKDKPKLFRIISNTKLKNENEDDIHFNVSVKPICFNRIYKPDIINEKYIDTFYYYSTDLLNVDKLPKGLNGYNTLKMLNLYDSTIHIPILLENYLKNLRTQYYENKLTYNENKTHFFNSLKDKSLIAVVNYIHKNYKNCGYDFIEIIDNQLDKKHQKITVYVCPSNLFDKSIPQTYKYLNNFMDLESSHIEMLTYLKKLYYNDKYNCYVHQTTTIYFSCLHFHILKKNDSSLYKRDYSKLESGSYLIQDLNLYELINNLKINPNYYKKYNYSLIKDY